MIVVMAWIHWPYHAPRRFYAVFISLTAAGNAVFFICQALRVFNIIPASAT